MALKLTGLSFLLFSCLYTGTVWLIAQATPDKGQAERVTVNGKTIYKNIGERFDSDEYFWSRPSAVNYNAAGAAGSNKGPTNPDYLATVQARIDTVLVHHPYLKKEQVPSDLVTASGSGLDPHISAEAAAVQVQRVAMKRGMSYEAVSALLKRSEEGYGIGPKVINVNTLNSLLDETKN